MNTAPEPSARIVFGRFQVLHHRREVFADGEPLKLGGRAFDLLMALIEARGAVRPWGRRRRFSPRSNRAGSPQSSAAWTKRSPVLIDE